MCGLWERYADKMNMKNAGWVKKFRKELEWMSDLSDMEYRYYDASRLIAVWDNRSKYFGTFDARTDSVKTEMCLDWSNGKINQVKNALIEKGVFKKEKGFRLAIVNADIFLSKGRKGESVVRDSETNLQRDENYIQRTESAAEHIRASTRSIALNKRVFQAPDIQPGEYPQR